MAGFRDPFTFSSLCPYSNLAAPLVFYSGTASTVQPPLCAHPQPRYSGVRVPASAHSPFHCHIVCVPAFGHSRLVACRAILSIRGRVLQSAAFKSTGAAHPWHRGLSPCSRLFIASSMWSLFLKPSPGFQWRSQGALAAADPKSLVCPDVLVSIIVSFDGYCPRHLGLDGFASSLRRSQF